LLNDDNNIISTSSDKTIRIWDINKEINSHILNINSIVLSIYLDQPNKLLIGCVDGLVRIIDNNNFAILQMIKVLDNPIKTLVMMDMWLIAGGNDYILKAINLQTYESKCMLGHSGWINIIM